MNTTTTNHTKNFSNTFANRCKESYKAFVAEIEQAKDMIMKEFNETLDTHGNLFRLALNEAEVLAEQTGYPHLFYPALATERVQAVADWRRRQQTVSQRQLF